jgi:NAD(P)-dependent dehydrogenase (short-subunit alcohol dehydrogenase family)
MTALITGASSGIGLELARVFAKNRHDVVLVARRESKLRELAAEVQGSGIRAHVIVSDLSAPGAVPALADRVRGLGVDVDNLVNNAGYGLYGPFLETSLDTELAMIQVNIVALTELTKRMLPGMVARKSGRILNLASTAAFLPGPLMGCVLRDESLRAVVQRGDCHRARRDRCHRDRVVPWADRVGVSSGGEPRGIEACGRETATDGARRRRGRV